MLKGKQLIAYLRVSTKEQGQSGLGLEGQQEMVESFARQNEGEIAATYVEVESGKRGDRPQLSEAIAHSKLLGATLVVAKLDRLARNVAFLSALMESGVDFICCDNPNANRLTIHILAAVAEDETRRISARTRDALQAAKRRGVKLGSARPGHWEGREHLRNDGLKKAREASVIVRRKQACERLAFLFPKLQEMRDRGLSYAKIAEQLTAQGFRTPRGKPWTPMAAHRACRLGEPNST